MYVKDIAAPRSVALHQVLAVHLQLFVLLIRRSQLYQDRDVDSSYGYHSVVNIMIKAWFPLPELTGDRFPLPVPC